jgi:hypothetical protein
MVISGGRSSLHSKYHRLASLGWVIDAERFTFLCSQTCVENNAKDITPVTLQISK